MGFEDFEHIFGEPKAEWSASTSTPLRPFLFHVHALDSSRLRFHVTDFLSNTWEAVRSVPQLEDLRDNIGIGGSWSEFVDYLVTSIKSGDVKLVLEGQSKSDEPAYAKLVVQKSKGMPRIVVSLGKLRGGAAGEAMANLSLELHKAFKSTHKLLIHEQEGRYQLTRMMSLEKEKNENLQRQLDGLLNPKRQKSQNINGKVMYDTSSTTALLNTPDKQSSPQLGSKAVNRVVPAYRRAKVRGAILQDTEDDADN